MVGKWEFIFVHTSLWISFQMLCPKYRNSTKAARDHWRNKSEDLVLNMCLWIVLLVSSHHWGYWDKPCFNHYNLQLRLPKYLNNHGDFILDTLSMFHQGLILLHIQYKFHFWHFSLFTPTMTTFPVTFLSCRIWAHEQVRYFLTKKLYI